MIHDVLITGNGNKNESAIRPQTSGYISGVDTFSDLIEV